MQMLFQNLGLNEKETRVWLKLLELGAQPVSVIAKFAGLPRSTMYSVLEKLKELQLIETFERHGVLFMKCIPVNSLIDIVQARERTLENTLLLLQEKLPQLEALENKLSITPQVSFLEGKTGAMLMYEEVLKEKTFYAAFNPAFVKKYMPEYIYKVAEELAVRKGTAKELVVDSEIARMYKKKFETDRHFIKILPKEVIFFSDNIICKQKIYMIAYGNGQISVTKIVNEALAHTHRTLFEELWKRLI